MEYNDILSKVKKIHFIGIGGSGMCPIAEILLHRGFELTGSDISESDTLERVRSYGIPVFMGQKAENINGAELVVYSAAVKQDNPELVAAREQNIPAVERSVMLGMVTRRYRNAVAVSGTHGKTTTTAMITQILLGAGKDPSAIIGGKLPLIKGNGRVGHSDTIVCEACEYVDTFLQLYPSISVILNIDNDHLDYFGTVENTIHSFHRFAEQTSQLIVANGDNENTKKAVENIQGREIVTYGFGHDNDYYADEISDSMRAREQFSVFHHGKKLTQVALSVPGKHNIYNALAAFAVADALGVDAPMIAEHLHRFTGVHRRFERLGEFGGVMVADDFAHHPTEVEATLTAAKHMGFARVWAVFQPHTYSRTYLLLNEFAQALQIADRVVLSEILAVRETNTYNIYAKDLAAKIPGSIWFKTFDEIAGYMVENTKDGDLILTLGGGDVYKCANLIVQKLQDKYEK
ncbi:MAG: UDP-N-acetylmuramate--L-alanine ligase [Oscillospiraceae bacterium]|jgi:UDP-N-acetylmuramate--alanine ligase|nr:UDP-N-acetylmuramate--L-alanine ligase [Oscillospiraceae bacterium]